MKSPTVERNVTAGVDTHLDFHVAAVLDTNTARLLDTASFPATSDGYVELHAWLASFGTIDTVGIESTGSYGAGLCRHLASESVPVIEVNRPDRSERRFNGKDDTIDAEAAARAVISGKAATTPKAGDGATEAIRALEVVYHSATKDRTRAINQFKALLITAPAGLRERLGANTFRRQLELARRFNDAHPDPVEREIRLALKELARRIGFLDEQTRRLDERINVLTAQANPALVGISGVGPHVAAQLLATAGDNPERLRSEAAFAKLCGACPIPASSGKSSRHRLNRGGDRRANKALFTIVLVRMRHDPRTRAYVARRTAEGKTRKEIMRCLKRFVAREVFHALTQPDAGPPTGGHLRAMRTERGLTLTHVSNQLGVAQVTLSRLERGVSHDTRVTTLTRDWLLTQPIKETP
jgi:transposase/DNA-binding XRE family transcriptional regulator